MRLPDDRFRRLARHVGLIALLPAALGGCAASTGDGDIASAGATAGVGPAADYPLMVGEPYRIGDRLYTPTDTLNYDEVGYVADDSGSGVTGAHHTLPLPSYAEVTSLETGRTILVRLERRGPMGGDALVALSPAAMAQLGVTQGTPVRLRRVNPPEDERAALRSGGTVPPRMDTPEALLAVLKRKLSESGSAQVARNAAPAPIAAVELAPSAAARELPPAASPAARAPARPLPAPPLPPLQGRSAAIPAPVRGQAVVVASLPPSQAAAQPAQVAQRAAPQPRQAVPVADDGAFVVQVAALSSFDRAQRIAGAIGGHVEQSGRFYRIRTGPFATRSQAEASLAKVRAAGYSEARIFTNG